MRLTLISPDRNDDPSADHVSASLELQRRGDVAGAVAATRAALRSARATQAPDDDVADLLTQLAELLLDVGNADGCRRAVADATRLAPGNPMVSSAARRIRQREADVRAQRGAAARAQVDGRGSPGRVEAQVDAGGAARFGAEGAAAVRRGDAADAADDAAAAPQLRVWGDILHAAAELPSASVEFPLGDSTPVLLVRGAIAAEVLRSTAAAAKEVLNAADPAPVFCFGVHELRATDEERAGSGQEGQGRDGVVAVHGGEFHLNESAPVEGFRCGEAASGSSGRELLRAAVPHAYFHPGESEAADGLVRSLAAQLALPPPLSAGLQVAELREGAREAEHDDCAAASTAFPASGDGAALARGTELIEQGERRSGSPIVSVVAPVRASVTVSFRGAHGARPASGADGAASPPPPVAVSVAAGDVLLWRTLDAHGECDGRLRHALGRSGDGDAALVARLRYHALPQPPTLRPARAAGGGARDVVECDSPRVGGCRRVVASPQARASFALLDSAQAAFDAEAEEPRAARFAPLAALTRVDETRAPLWPNAVAAARMARWAMDELGRAALAIEVGDVDGPMPGEDLRVARLADRHLEYTLKALERHDGAAAAGGAARTAALEVLRRDLHLALRRAQARAPPGL